MYLQLMLVGTRQLLYPSAVCGCRGYLSSMRRRIQGNIEFIKSPFSP